MNASATGVVERRALRPPPPGGLKRVLLVDDEAHVLRVLRLRLDRNGYEVDTALDAEVALRLLRERRHAALITSEELALGEHGLCACVRRHLGEDAPLMLVMGDAPPADPLAPGRWEERLPEGAERVERPVSLRWIVARLNEYFGDYDAV